MHFLVFGGVVVFPLLNHFLRQLLARAAVHCVLGHTALELLELVLNFLALSLFFVQLGLQLARHPVVAILRLLQVEAHLMHVGERVQVLVLVKQLVGRSLVLTVLVVAQDDFALQLVVLLAQCFVLSTLVFDGLNQFALHLVLTWKVTHTAVVVLLHIFILDLFLVVI